jgi:glutathione-independent formaldehyde dehydrogenase
LDEAPESYKHFDDKDKGWTKVILKPRKTAGKKKVKKTVN